MLSLQCGLWVSGLSYLESDTCLIVYDLDMSVEGIFRKNGNIKRLNATMEAIDRDPSSVDFTQDNPVQLAALLKKFLGNLPEPLMTFKLHRLFAASQRQLYLHFVLSHELKSFSHRSAVRRRAQALSSLYIAHHAETPPRYYGSPFCFLEVGCVFCTHGFRDGQPDGPS